MLNNRKPIFKKRSTKNKYKSTKMRAKRGKCGSRMRNKRRKNKNKI